LAPQPNGVISPCYHGDDFINFKGHKITKVRQQHLFPALLADFPPQRTQGNGYRFFCSNRSRRLCRACVQIPVENLLWIRVLRQIFVLANRMFQALLAPENDQQVPVKNG